MKKFLAILFAVITIFVSACFFVGCDDGKKPSQNQTTQQPGNGPGDSGVVDGDGTGGGNTTGRPVITPDGDGIQFPAIP